MKIKDKKVFEGPNIYSHRKCIRFDVNLEGYCEIPSNKIPDFNFNLVNLIPELKTHRCGIDEEGGFVKRLEEGTYLAHISEHCIIALQNRLGIEVCYGKAREIEGDNYYIIIEYKYKKVAIEIAILVVDLVNSLIKKIPINFGERIKRIDEIYKEEQIGPSTKGVCDAAIKYGLPIVQLEDSQFYQIGYGKQGRIIEAAITNKTSCVAVDISCDKLLTKKLLDIQSIPVANGAKVYNIISLLKEAEYIGYPLVLKPQFGNKGKGVILNIKNEKELVVAYEKVRKAYTDILIEEYVQGEDYRVCIVNYNVVAVSKRIPPTVVGDGKSTILQLIKRENDNELRGYDHEKPLTKIEIDDEVLGCIKSNNYTLNSILDINEELRLRKNANLSTGGEAIDYTDIISEENKEICIRAAKAIGLDVCGIDICTEDISKSLNNSGIIMEINAAPGLRMHLHPSVGDRREVGEDILKMLYSNNPKNIPIISITGTNGKTTTTRGISYAFNKMGYTVGMTTSHGVYIGDKCIHKGDDTGFESARSVLLNKDVDIAVLETARGGIIKKGLAYEKADVAIITNIREDHLGIDEVDSMEQLCFVKSLVAEEIKENGHVVINADDYWSRKILDRIKSEVIFFSKDYNNELVLKNKSKNLKCIYVKDNNVIACNMGKEYIISNIDDIPLTHKGILQYNIENILAMAAGLMALNIDYAMIKNTIEGFGTNIQDNKGRFNVYSINGINVILDYGHNLDGYEAVLPGLKKFSKGKCIGIVGIPGDRNNEMAINIGKISNEYLDYIIVKEDKNSRGREKGEISNLILQGINNKDKSQIIIDECEALEKAISIAKKDDTIIVFFEDEESLIDVINKIDSIQTKAIN